MSNSIMMIQRFLLDQEEIIRDSASLSEDVSTEQIVALILLAGLLVIATWFFFVWAIRDKQFEEVEEVSKRVLELDAEPNHAEPMPQKG